MQLKDAIALAYGDSLAARATNRADSVTAKVVKTHEQEGNDVESEEGVDVTEMGSDVIFSEIPEE